VSRPTAYLPPKILARLEEKIHARLEEERLPRRPSGMVLGGKWTSARYPILRCSARICAMNALTVNFFFGVVMVVLLSQGPRLFVAARRFASSGSRPDLYFAVGLAPLIHLRQVDNAVPIPQPNMTKTATTARATMTSERRVSPGVKRLRKAANAETIRSAVLADQANGRAEARARIKANADVIDIPNVLGRASAPPQTPARRPIKGALNAQDEVGFAHFARVISNGPVECNSTIVSASTHR
jgi:hypothetical protein